MAAAHQLALPFACLDFPGRESVALWEIAGKLGVSVQHVIDHVDAGRLVALDTKLIASRRNLRVAVDEYRRWVLGMLTAPAQRTLLSELPPATLRELRRAIDSILSSHTPEAPHHGAQVTRAAALPANLHHP